MATSRAGGVVASWLVVGACLTAGCGRDAAHQAGSMGERLGENVTGFAKGVGRGIDKNLQVSIELSAGLRARGLSTSVAKMGGLGAGEGQSRSVSIYLLAERPCELTLVAKAFDEADQEIGRARAKIKFDADDAQYVNFEFPSEMDQQLVVKYLIDERTEPTAEANEAP